jgi:predicted transcriptional regulator of viral defense system
MNKKPLKGEFLDALLRSTKTIFSTKDIALLWEEANETVVTNRLKQYERNGKLIRVRRGLYAKDANYNRFELATRINTPSYISFETVLTNTGTNFQYYGNIFIASYVGREMIIDKQVYCFVHMKDYVLTNTIGIEHTNGIAMACKERAFLDRLYVNKNYYLDNAQSLNWEKVLEILPIYHNKRMENEVIKLHKVNTIKK